MPIISRGSQQCCKVGIYIPKFQIRKLRLRKLTFLKDAKLGNNGSQAAMDGGLSEFFHYIRPIILKTPLNAITSLSFVYY